MNTMHFLKCKEIIIHNNFLEQLLISKMMNIFLIIVLIKVLTIIMNKMKKN